MKVELLFWDLLAASYVKLWVSRPIKEQAVLKPYFLGSC